MNGIKTFTKKTNAFVPSRKDIDAQLWVKHVRHQKDYYV